MLLQAKIGTRSGPNEKRNEMKEKVQLTDAIEKLQNQVIQSILDINLFVSH